MHLSYPDSLWSQHIMNSCWNNNIPTPSEEEMVACISNVQSGLTVVESPSSATADLLGSQPSSDSYLWTQVLPRSSCTVGSNKNGQDIRENLLSSLSSKSLTSSHEQFERQTEWLKGADWEYTSSTSVGDARDKQLNDFEDPARFNNLPGMLKIWSTPTHEPYLDRHIAPNSTNNRYLDSGMPLVKQDPHTPLYLGGGKMDHNGNNVNPIHYPCYGQGLEDSEIIQEADISGSQHSSLIQNERNNDFGYNNIIGLKNSSLGDQRYGIRGLSEAPSYEPHVAMHYPYHHIPQMGCMKQVSSQSCTNILATKGQVPQDISKKIVPDVSPAKRTVRGGLGSEAKKRKLSKNGSDSSCKKPKSDGSTASSPKTQIPKAKVGERITALQQIVSPFGKTDTASVLHEAIGCIKYLHEQVQLLSNPYIKAGIIKDPCGWGRLERKEIINAEVRLHGLKSRGLCLVPVSWTPQMFRDNTGPDYLTPTDRGCFYR